MRIFNAGSKGSVGKHWVLRICTFNLDIGVSALPSKAIQFGLHISSDKSDGTWFSLSLSLPLVTIFLCFDSLRLTSDPELDGLLLQMSDKRTPRRDRDAAFDEDEDSEPRKSRDLVVKSYSSCGRAVRSC